MKALILCVLFLAGCASTPEPEVVTRTVQVKVPVWMKCEVRVPPVAPYATSTLSKTDTDFEKIKQLLVERSQREHTEKELRALLGVCTNEP